MSRKCSLSTQTGKVQFVIRENRYIDKELFIEFGKLYCEEYSFICHEHDIEPKTGVVEGIHYHFVCKLCNSHTRLSTTLNNICSHFGCKNEMGISIEKWNSYEGALQYLIHKNQPDKTQHNIEEIITNIKESDFKLYMTVDMDDSFSYDLVFSKCLSCNNLLDVYKELWPFMIKSSNYRTIIKDIWFEVHK